MDSLYALDNVLTIKITMPQSDWDAVRYRASEGRTVKIRSGPAAPGSRGAKPTSVEISGSRLPGVRRRLPTSESRRSRSVARSTVEKPCLHIDFGRFCNKTSDAVQALIGTRYLTLNNSIQDRSYVRQTLGYRLLEMAGLPHSRCNYARVFVNGTLIGEGFGGVKQPPACTSVPSRS